LGRPTCAEKGINPDQRAAEREALVQRFKSLRNEGLFTPPSFEGSISMPGHNGGANFATSAVDPARGEMYVVAKALPTVDRLTLPGQSGRGGVAGPVVTPGRSEERRVGREGRSGCGQYGVISRDS